MKGLRVIGVTIPGAVANSVVLNEMFRIKIPYIRAVA